MSEIVESSIVSDTPHELDLNKPAPSAFDDAPEPKGPSREEVKKAGMNAALLIAAECEDPDVYRQEREDQERLKRGDADYSWQREQRQERHLKLQEQIAKAEAAKLGTTPHRIEQTIEEAKAEGLEIGEARERFSQYEDANPGWLDHMDHCAEIYGAVSDDVAKALRKSRFGPQLANRIYEVAQTDNPDFVDEINSWSPDELRDKIKEAEGAFAYHKAPPRYLQQQQPEPPKARIISQAPKPVTTVAGKSHQSGKTPDEMSNDEYRKWRERQIKAREGR